MCGIAGYYGTKPIDSNRINRCLQLMNHRGPDASGTFYHSLSDSKHLHLLHTRLSIIDCDPRSNQPYSIGPYTFVFNGEMYNYREVKSDLESNGCVFKTDSDTEVLMQQLITQGYTGLDQCEGMWSFAFYDKRDGLLMLSRDRFGEKPFYIYEDETGIYFGSEIKFLRALIGKPLEINYEHIYRYMVNGYKALYKGNNSFYVGVSELRPGTVLNINANFTKQEQMYWHPDFVRDEEISQDEFVTQIREELIRSVDLRLRADVPLAFLMSGGIDSNSLISIAKRVFDYDVHGFTLVDKDKRYDEQELVDHAVKELRIRHTVVPTDTTDFLENLRALVIQHDAPVCTISYYAHWLLLKAIAAHGYKISISGTAADELFTGYYDHHNAYLYEVMDDEMLSLRSNEAWQEHVSPIVRNPYLIDPKLFVNTPDFRDHIFLDADVFSNCLTQPWQEQFSEKRYCKGLLRNRMLNELFHESVPAILHEDDHNSMSQSIENRTPFLDRGLFELSQRIPTRYLIQNGYAKFMLRQAMRGIVPDRILNERRKVGFNAAITSFVDFEDKDTRAAILDDSPIYKHVKKSCIKEIINQPSLPNSKSKFIFNFLNCKFFLEEFAHQACVTT